MLECRRVAGGIPFYMRGVVSYGCMNGYNPYTEYPQHQQKYPPGYVPPSPGYAPHPAAPPQGNRYHRFDAMIHITAVTEMKTHTKGGVPYSHSSDGKPRGYMTLTGVYEDGRAVHGCNLSEIENPDFTPADVGKRILCGVSHKVNPDGSLDENPFINRSVVPVRRILDVLIKKNPWLLSGTELAHLIPEDAGPPRRSTHAAAETETGFAPQPDDDPPDDEDVETVVPINEVQHKSGLPDIE